MRSLALILSVWLWTTGALAADWHRATSEHYVVHARMDPGELSETVQRMEDFHRVLEAVLPRQTQPTRKAQIFLEESVSKISALRPVRVSGFSGTNSENMISYSQFDASRNPKSRFYNVHYAQAQLYIENGYFRTHAPWVLVGVPSFFRTVITSEEGAYLLGVPDQQRGASVLETRRSDLERLFSLETWPDNQTQFERSFQFSFQVASVLLLETKYSGRLENYLSAFSSGKSFEEARLELGDLQELAEDTNARFAQRAGRNNSEFRRRRDRTAIRRTIRQLTLPPETAALRVEPMARAEVDLIRPRFERLLARNLKRTSQELAKLTRQYPERADVWFEFAAAEFARVRDSLYGEQPFNGFGFSNGEIFVNANPYTDTEAWNAVNKALELDPDYTPAKVVKAEILMNRLVQSNEEDESEGFEEVRARLAPMASAAEDNPLAAALYFQSFVEQGETPTPRAIDQLGRAFSSNPGVDSIRYAYAVSLARQGQRESARILLSSMLNNPDYKEAAQRALGEAG
ncbi:MAG: hypothetical protein AAF650_10915 [Pseudomonadota bacterium]